MQLTGTLHQNSWKPMRNKPRAISSIVENIRVRLADEALLTKAWNVAATQSQYPHLRENLGHSLATGYAGLALLAGYLDAIYPEQEWDYQAHQYLTLAVQSLQVARMLDPGLLTGYTGTAFAALQLSKRNLRYRKVREVLHEYLIHDCNRIITKIQNDNYSTSYPDYDVVCGLSGIVVYLLIYREEKDMYEMLLMAIRALIKITRVQEGRYNWYIRSTSRRPHDWDELFPSGFTNCGLAHGIPGILSALALAKHAGVSLEEMDEAIERIASWLITHQTGSPWGKLFSPVVPIDPKETTPITYVRSAWCYGNPGVARSLWLAGVAIHNESYKEAALAAMEEVFSKPVDMRYLHSPTFCHGIAGLLQITLRFYHDTGLDLFESAAISLLRQLEECYHPDSLLGYQDVEESASGIVLVDDPGLLNGASGVLLVLLAASSSVEPTWDRMFLLS